MICSSFPNLANMLLGWGVNIHPASLPVWGVPATCLTPQQKGKNHLSLYEHKLSLKSVSLFFET